MSRERAASLELILAAAIWGFGFIATRWALADIGPFWLSAARFLLVVAIVAPWILARPELRRDAPRQLRLALGPGFFLGSSLVLQTAGLELTTATNSGFITTLYVLFVPVLAWIFLRQKVRAAHFALVALALVGTALICRLQTLTVSVGDLLTLGCAVLAAGHLLWLSAIGKKVGSPLAFNAYQALWAGLFALIVAAAFEPIRGVPGPRALVGLAFLTLVSTLIAFLLQVRAQRVLPASLASLICLLESPFAAGFAFVLLGERLGAMQWFGAALILVASVAAIKLEAPAAADGATARSSA